MTPDQLQRRDALFARNDAALDRWPGGEDPAFKQEVEAIAHALQDLAAEADAESGDRLERSRTWRYAGNAFYDLSSGDAGPALQRAYEAYLKADALLEGIDDAEEWRKLDYCLGHTLMGLSRGEDVELAREARRRYARSLQAARRVRPEAVAPAENALAKAERLVAALEAADHLSQEIEDLEERLQQRQAAPSPGATEVDPMAQLFEVLKREVEAEKQKGTMDTFQQEELDQVMGELGDLVRAGSSSQSLDENLTDREKLNALAERMRPRIRGSAFEQASGRAGRVLGHIQALKAYVVAETMRPGKAPGEADKGQDLFVRLGRLTTTLTQAEAGQLRRIEREVARPLAREVRWYGRRRHLTLARPRWTREEPPADPNLVFFSGPDRVRRAVLQAAEPVGLEVSPASYTGADAAAARWHDLAAATLAVFDLSDHTPQGFYELGIALTVGTNVLLLAESGTAIPFDVAQDVHYYADNADLPNLLPDALDDALYGLQTKHASGSSLRESVAYLERLIQAEPDTSVLHTALEHIRDLTADPVKVRAALNLVNSYLDAEPLVPLYPRWPGVYPDPQAARCFVVMPFREELGPVYEGIAEMCRRAEITPVRGDVAEGQDIVDSIWEEIGRATHLVVDLTGLNPNVCLELGIADTLGRPTLLIGRHGTETRLFPSIAKRRCHTYAADVRSEPGIRRALERFFRFASEAAAEDEGLWVHEPEARAPATEAPPPPAEEPPADEPPADEPPAAGVDWKGLAVGLLTKGIEAFIESRAHRPSSTPPAAAGSRPSTPVLTGTWVTGDGLPVHFTQQGTTVSFRSVNPYGMPAVEGQGTVHGYAASLTFRLQDGHFYDEGRADMQISPDGRQMHGTIRYARSGIRFVGLTKQSV